MVSRLYSEFRELLPDAAVKLFISYYDVYTPEAYIPSKDLYIEKEAQINEEIGRLRHAATQALLTTWRWCCPRNVVVRYSLKALFLLAALLGL